MISSSESIEIYVKDSIASNTAQWNLFSFIAAHCSILSVDHLGVLNAKQTDIINSVSATHFESNLKQSIGDNCYIILIDKSTDISVNRFLGRGNLFPTLE
ncbi:DUF4371 domain-containing protein [Aphis craccivora]|uniref:DUF4371 domain-containing protein n=1 Tax=Aphis craccivora TaxID=307492 RepID=A0A6G0YB52_APHCR|nr:DUF4371 domain-containing protein [Aphis craccivora]